MIFSLIRSMKSIAKLRWGKQALFCKACSSVAFFKRPCILIASTTQLEGWTMKHNVFAKTRWTSVVRDNKAQALDELQWKLTRWTSLGVFLPLCKSQCTATWHKYLRMGTSLVHLPSASMPCASSWVCTYYFIPSFYVSRHHHHLNLPPLPHGYLRVVKGV